MWKRLETQCALLFDQDDDVNIEKYYLDIEVLSGIDFGYNRNQKAWINNEFAERVEYKKYWFLQANLQGKIYFVSVNLYICK